MPACEKCWGDAYTRYRCDSSKNQADHYQDLLKERASNACTSEQQAGHIREDPHCGCRLCEDHGEGE